MLWIHNAQALDQYSLCTGMVSPAFSNAFIAFGIHSLDVVPFTVIPSRQPVDAGLRMGPKSCRAPRVIGIASDLQWFPVV